MNANKRAAEAMAKDEFARLTYVQRRLVTGARPGLSLWALARPRTMAALERRGIVDAHGHVTLWGALVGSQGVGA